jgi:DNA-binding MarR family transcriptional regulator
MQPDQDQEDAFSRLMSECFKTNRQLVSAVARLTNGSGISGAQWGVLGAFGGSDESLTVAQTARRLGLTRQGVQRVADLLANKGLIEYLPNPNHRRAKLAKLTDQGRNLLAQLQARESRWAQRAAGDLDIKAVEAATELVQSIRERLLD